MRITKGISGRETTVDRERNVDFRRRMCESDEKAKLVRRRKGELVKRVMTRFD